MLVREFLVVVPDLANDAVFACAGRALGLVLCDASGKLRNNLDCERSGEECNKTNLW